jgi:RNA polymerase sigma-70 factor (ECF subfamily)
MKGLGGLGNQEGGAMHRPHPAPKPEEPARDAGQLFRAHAQQVARWAARLGGPGIDVEDVVQEVFVKVHRLLPEFRGEAEVSTWLYRITENVVRSRRRTLRVRGWLRGIFHGEAEATTVRCPTPLEQLERREAQRFVYRVLDRIPERYRTVFVLFEIEGLSGDEIARLTGRKPATVWVQLKRARDQFFARARRLERAEEAS